ncbi:MAG: hypothetical protein IT443_00600 [Phycisphaeraceae bacterium]|nr:hypothetical protein [Phycisphaeraceae bacterium]
MVLYACKDLIFATRIRSTADALGLVSHPACHLDSLRRHLIPPAQPSAPGAVRVFFVDLDLGADALSLTAWVKQNSPSIAVICFGAHVQTDMLHQARALGADLVLPRSQFTSLLPQLLKRFTPAPISPPPHPLTPNS